MPASIIDWSDEELLDAQRRRRKLRTTTQGMHGVILEVRESDVVLRLDFGGRAYLQKSCLATPPPSAIGTGDRVLTTFGRGRVRQTRVALQGCDHVVELLDCVLAGGLPALAYLGTDSIRRRASDDRTFEEMLEDSAVFRTRGNESFKGKDYDAALVEYRKVLDVFGALPRSLTLQQRSAVRDSVVKALSNAAQCYLSLTPPDYELARQQCTHALEIDPGNVTGQREKLLYRRGLACAGLGEWDAAAVDLASPDLAGNDHARAKLASVKDSARKEKEKNKKMWGNAFKKAAAETGDEVEVEGEPGDAPIGSEASEADALGGARTTSTPTRPASGVRFANTPVEASFSPASPGSAGAGGKGSARTAGAGRTPYKRPSAAAQEEDGEEEVETGGAGAGGGDQTAEAEQEEEEVEGGLFSNPWVLGAGAVALAGAALVGYRLLSRK